MPLSPACSAMLCVHSIDAEPAFAPSASMQHHSCIVPAPVLHRSCIDACACLHSSASMQHPCSTRAASLLHPCSTRAASFLHRCLCMLAFACIVPASMLAYACIPLHRCLHMLAFACIEPNRPKAKRAGSFDSLTRESSRRARRVTAREERERGRTPVPPPSSFVLSRPFVACLVVCPSLLRPPRPFVAFSSLLHSFSFFHRLPCRLPRPSPSFSSFPVPVSLSPWSGALLVS